MKPADKPVLCVVSSHPIKGASGVPTGFFLAELTHPFQVLEYAGLKTTIARIREVYESHGIVSAVCHGPAALVDAKLSRGEYLVKGKNVAAFTNN